MAYSWNLGRFIGDILTPAENDREFNSAEAAANREWEEEMAKSAYQNSVADMQAAGLNPAMMYANGGQGASTPTGSAARSNASNSSLLSAIFNGVSSAAQLSNNKNMSKSTAANINNSASSLLYKALDILA